MAELHAALVAAGGIAGWADLVRASSAATVRSALVRDTIRRVGRGVYALSTHSEPRVGDPTLARAWSRWTLGPTDAEVAALVARHAHARGCFGALSHRCAASHHGWPVLCEPPVLEIALPHGRRGFTHVADQPVRLCRHDLAPAERREHATSHLRTVIDCAVDLPWPEALAIADSALRAGSVEPGELIQAADRYRGRGAPRVRRVAQAADGHSANPFESALRAVLADVPEVRLPLQHEITHGNGRVRVDLADPDLRIVVEADSYEFHGSVEAFARDRRRYTELTAAGWTVLPFCFGDVMKNPGWVREMVRAAALVRST